MARSHRFRGWQSWLLSTTLLAAALVVANAILFEINRSLQVEVNSRAQYIQQTVQLEALHREMVAAIANLANRNNDDALRSVLLQHGIGVSPAAGPSPAAPSAAPVPAKPGSR
jgi:hypothetical protein